MEKMGTPAFEEELLYTSAWPWGRADISILNLPLDYFPNLYFNLQSLFNLTELLELLKEGKGEEISKLVWEKVEIYSKLLPFLKPNIYPYQAESIQKVVEEVKGIDRQLKDLWRKMKKDFQYSQFWNKKSTQKQYWEKDKDGKRTGRKVWRDRWGDIEFRGWSKSFDLAPPEGELYPAQLEPFFDLASTLKRLAKKIKKDDRPTLTRPQTVTTEAVEPLTESEALLRLSEFAPVIQKDLEAKKKVIPPK